MRGATRSRAIGLVEIGRLQAATSFVYRADYLFGLVGVLLQVWLLEVVWTAVYGDRSAVSGAGVDSVPLDMQIAYSTLATVQYWLVSPWNFSSTPQRIREGTIALDLVRPVGFLTQSVGGQIGATMAMLPFAILALPFAIAIGGAAFPSTPTALLGYVASLAMAYWISTLLNVLVGLVAFWTLEVQGIFMVYRMVGQFMGGALVPLWFMPGWLRGVAEWLPFQATTYTPLRIYFGQVDGVDVAIALGQQFLWIGVLAVALRLMWSRALRLVIVQGG